MTKLSVKKWWKTMTNHVSQDVINIYKNWLKSKVGSKYYKPHNVVRDDVSNLYNENCRKQGQFLAYYTHRLQN